MKLYRAKRIFWTFWDRRAIKRTLRELELEPVDNYDEYHTSLNSHKYPFTFAEPSFYKKHSTRSLNFSLCIMHTIELIIGNRENMRQYHKKLFKKGELHYMNGSEFNNEQFNEWYERSSTNKYMALKCIVI